MSAPSHDQSEGRVVRRISLFDKKDDGKNMIIVGHTSGPDDSVVSQIDIGPYPGTDSLVATVWCNKKPMEGGTIIQFPWKLIHWDRVAEVLYDKEGLV